MEKSLDSEYCRPAHFGRPLTRSRQKEGEILSFAGRFFVLFCCFVSGNKRPPNAKRETGRQQLGSKRIYNMQPRLNTFQDKKKTKTSRSRDFLIAIHRPTVTGVLHLVVQQQLENPKKGKIFLRKK
jgi:hypothetical protein